MLNNIKKASGITDKGAKEQKGGHGARRQRKKKGREQRGGGGTKGKT